MKHRLQMDLSPPGCVETTLSILNVLQGIRLRSKPPFRLARQTQIHLQPVFHEVSGLKKPETDPLDQGSAPGSSIKLSWINRC